MGRETINTATFRLNTGPDNRRLSTPIDVCVTFVRSLSRRLYDDDETQTSGEAILIGYEVLDAWIEPETLARLTPELATWAIESAEDLLVNPFSNNGGNHVKRIR